MAIGGTFVTHNKILPGAYINFISKARALGTLSDRGVAALAFANNWCPENEVISITSEDFQTSAINIFGYDYTDDKLKPIREIFKNAIELKLYRLGKGEVAYTTIGNLRVIATCSGSRGNDIKIKISQAVDSDNFTVYTYVDTTLVDEQEVSSIDNLIDNDFVKFSIVVDNSSQESSNQESSNQESSSDSNSSDLGTESEDNALQEDLLEEDLLVENEDEEDLLEVMSTTTNTQIYSLEATAGTNLSGGLDYVITNNEYSEFLAALESESFNTLIYDGDDYVTKGLFDSFTKRLRDQEGSKITTVLYNYPIADFEGVISVKNDVNLVYWVAGATAGAEINQSITNKTYDGEYTFNGKYSNTELKEAIQDGQLLLFEDGGEFKVLKDINTFTNFSTDKNSDFSNNQIIRVIDSTANDIARIFNDYYLGKMQNDNLGRDIFKSELINYFRTLQAIRAIDNFDPDDIYVQKGTEKGDVVVDVQIEPIASMDKLYMKCVIA